MHSKLRVGTGLCLFLAAIAAHAGLKTELLNIGDVNSDLRVLQGTPLDAVNAQKITYAVTGDPAYDAFFKKAAVAYGGFAVGHRMSEEVAVNLKRLAGAWVESTKASGELKSLLKDKDFRALPLERVGTILKEKKAQLGRLEQQEIECLVKAAQQLAVAGVSLTGSIEAAASLLPQTQPLVANAGKAFALWDFPGVAKEVLASTKRLMRIKDEALPLAKNVSTMAALVAELVAGS